MVERAEHYVWSSAAAHCGLREDMLQSGDCPVVREIKNWSEWLRLENAKGVDDVIRLHTRTGRPLGSKGFIGGIEEQKGRKLLPQKRGPRSKLKQAEKSQPGRSRTANNRDAIWVIYTSVPELRSRGL